MGHLVLTADAKENVTHLISSEKPELRQASLFATGHIRTFNAPVFILVSKEQSSSSGSFITALLCIHFL
jgi:hypothetical protein